MHIAGDGGNKPSLGGMNLSRGCAGKADAIVPWALHSPGDRYHPWRHRLSLRDVPGTNLSSSQTALRVPWSYPECLYRKKLTLAMGLELSFIDTLLALCIIKIRCYWKVKLNLLLTEEHQIFKRPLRINICSFFNICVCKIFVW